MSTYILTHDFSRNFMYLAPSNENLFLPSGREFANCKN